MRQFVFVVGMHRSGTSLVSGSLVALGCTPPLDLMPGNPENPKGYFEPWQAVALNNAIFDSLDYSWNDTRPLPDAALLSSLPWVDRIADFLATGYPETGLALMKDPRATLLLPLWIAALTKLGQKPAFIIPVRRPEGTAASLLKRDGFGPNQSLALWLRYVLDAEFYTRAHRRTFLVIDSFISDPVAALDKAGHDLCLHWPNPAATQAAALASFIEPEMLKSGTAIASPLMDHAERVHAALLRLAGDAKDSAAHDDLDVVRATVNGLLGSFRSFDDRPDALRSTVRTLQTTVAGIPALDARLAEAERAVEFLRAGNDEKTGRIALLSDEVRSLRQHPVRLLWHTASYQLLRLLAQPALPLPARMKSRLVRSARKADPARDALTGRAMRDGLRAPDD